MNIQEISDLYAKSPQVAALVKLLEDKSVTTVFLQGLVASAAPMMFASAARRVSPMCLFVLNDAEEAGYFYHDLTQIMGNTDVLFFPSSYRRQVKYGQRDPVVQYKVMGYDMFDAMTTAITEDTVRLLMHIQVEQKVEREQVAKVTGTNKDEGASVKGPVKRVEKKVYPNDLCPCGSGKKYKNCCGRQA